MFDWYRLKRYLGDMADHITWKRLINLLLVEYEWRLNKTILKGLPYQLIIDPNNICQIKCPLCFTGMGNLGRPKGQMEFALFKKIIDEAKDFSLHVFLHNWGEPLLNKKIVRFIRYSTEANLGTTMSTNLSLPLTEDIVEEIILSGLQNLIISLDGINEETYQKYRVGGDFSQVIHNINLFVVKKKELGKKLPFLEWQFLMMRHNEKEIEDARKMAQRLGLDSIHFPKIHLPHGKGSSKMAEEWFPRNAKRRFHRRYDKADNLSRRCWYLWRTVIINYDGGVSPCCYVDDKASDFGNINEESLQAIWNKQKYVSARAIFLRHKKTSSESQAETVCHTCSMVSQKGYLR